MSKDIKAGVQNKREKILRAALQVFSSKGYHTAKIEEIAQLADVGKGTVYEYFSSKAELFQEMVKAGMEFYHSSIAEQLKSGLSATEKLKQAARTHFRFIIEYRELAKITMSEHACLGGDFRDWLIEAREQKLEVIKNIILSGIEQGEFRKDLDVRAVTLVFTGIMGSLFGPLILGKENPRELEDTLEQMLDVLLKGINANPKPM